MNRFVVASLLLAAVVAGTDDIRDTFTEDQKYDVSVQEPSVGLKNPPTYECSASEIMPEDVEFIIYTRTRPYTGYRVKIDDMDTSLQQSWYNVRRQTKILIHGWAGTGNDTRSVVRKYLYEKPVDVIVVDYSKFSKCNYNSTINEVVPKVAFALGELIKKMTANGAQPEKTFHMIGFGIGGHIAGIAAKHVSPIRINRISALDITGYRFDCPGKLKLQNTDALFVDVIHTSQPNFGSTRVIGHQSFYPNIGAHPQPSCTDENLMCSTQMSILYWENSITHPQAYLGYRCNSWPQFIANNCPQVNGKIMTAYMGEYADPKALVGRYFLKAEPMKMVV